MSTITVTRLTDHALMHRAMQITANHDRPIETDPFALYKSEHSPIRTQLFWIEMRGIPTFVSTHFVRHHVGVQHYVQSNRADHGGDPDAGRMTLINHAMLINAQALISMARARLCRRASKETREVMNAIRHEMYCIDGALALAMVADCEYRGECHQPDGGCGWWTEDDE